MSTKKLPFKTAPKGFTVLVGNESVGVLEFPKYEDLTPNERIFIKTGMEGLPSVQEETLKLSKKIATNSGMKLLDVYEAFASGRTDLLQDYIFEFLELQDIQREVIPRERLIYATAVLKYRIEPDWTLEMTGDPELLHPALVKEIAEFAKKELNGWEAEPTPVTEDDLKKSSGEKAMKSTGEKSTGA